MAKQAGRLFVVKIGGTTVAGAREVSMTVNGSTIDATDADDTSYRKILDGEITDRSIDISISGLETDGVLKGISLGPASGWFISNLTLEWPNGDEISGAFVMGPYSSTGPYKDALTFSTSFMSDGAWTFTPFV